MKNVLTPGLYEQDGGRLLCHQCSGRTAQATGRDRSGHRVLRMTDADAADWLESFGEDMSCERCDVDFASVFVLSNAELHALNDRLCAEEESEFV